MEEDFRISEMEFTCSIFIEELNICCLLLLMPLFMSDTLILLLR